LLITKKVFIILGPGWKISCFQCNTDEKKSDVSQNQRDENYFFLGQQ
jgi:hypothetical protein